MEQLIVIGRHVLADEEDDVETPHELIQAVDANKEHFSALSADAFVDRYLSATECLVTCSPGSTRDEHKRKVTQTMNEFAEAESNQEVCHVTGWQSVLRSDNLL